MPEKGKRQLQAEQTKDKLFYAADALLAEKDYEDITIRDIISKADVSIGTFYHYFKTKLDVFYETYRVADHYFAEVVAPQLTQPTVREQILTFFDYYAHYSCDQTQPRSCLSAVQCPEPAFQPGSEPRHDQCADCGGSAGSGLRPDPQHGHGRADCNLFDGCQPWSCIQLGNHGPQLRPAGQDALVSGAAADGLSPGVTRPVPICISVRRGLSNKTKWFY